MRRTSIPRSAPGSNGIRGSIFHFTPISASWLNAVEGFFAKLTKHRLKRGVFKGIADLQTAINRYLVETNDNPKPFIWTADPDAIIEKKSGEGKRCWHRLAERFPKPARRKHVASVTHLHRGAPHGRSSPTSGALAEG